LIQLAIDPIIVNVKYLRKLIGISNIPTHGVSSMSSENIINKIVTSPLDGVLELLKILNEYSAKLTELAKAICRNLNLTEDLRITLLFGRLYEHEVEEGPLKPVEVKGVKDIIRRNVEGLYDPKKKAIMLPVPASSRDICTTLAHELIHHCQYTCRTNVCRSICEYWLSPEEADEIRQQIPYDFRPHEIEAYSKDKNLCSKLKEFKEYSEFENTMINAVNEVKQWLFIFMLVYGY